MIKPPKAVVISDGASRKKVYAYDYDALWRYCEILEKELELIDLFYKDDLSHDSDEIESIKGEA
jgi:hypothetical protein